MSRRSSPLARLLAGSLLLAGSPVLFGCAVTQEPMTQDEVAQRVSGDLHSMFAGQVPVAGTLTLADASARALRYNLDRRMRRADALVAENLEGLSLYDLLPRVTASGGAIRRNPNNTSLSENKVWDIDQTATWNILDFGVSYFRARQASNRTLVAEERRRKVVQAILQEVRSAFWRAERAQQLQKDIVRLRRRHEEAKAILSVTREEELRSPIDLFESEKNLLDSLRELQLLYREVASAPAELAGLMALPPGQSFALALPPPETSAALLPDWTTLPPLSSLESAALLRRPELREEDYQARITADETRAQLARALPGIELSATASNTYDTAFSWATVAGRLTASLMSILSAPAVMETGEAQEEAGRARRLALSMSILTQTAIAYERLQTAREELADATKLKEVADQLYFHSTAAWKAGFIPLIELTRREGESLLFRTRRAFAENEVQTAQARLLASVGVDPDLPDDLETVELTALARHLEPFVSLRDFRPWLAPAPRVPQTAQTSAPGDS